jgi:hypothetical protein
MRLYLAYRVCGDGSYELLCEEAFDLIMIIVLF